MSRSKHLFLYKENPDVNLNLLRTPLSPRYNKRFRGFRFWEALKSFFSVYFERCMGEIIRMECCRLIAFLVDLLDYGAVGWGFSELVDQLIRELVLFPSHFY
jgi:hypothetical protein